MLFRSHVLIQELLVPIWPGLDLYFHSWDFGAALPSYPAYNGVTQKGNSAGGCDVVARASRMEGRPRVVPECPRAQRRGEGVTGMEKCWSGKKDVK